MAKDMYLYIVIEIVLLVSLYLKHNRKIAYFMLLVLLTAVSSFRAYSVGADIPVYHIVYESVENMSWRMVLRSNDVCFSVLCKALNWMGLNFRGFLVSISIGVSCLLHIAIGKNKCDGILSLFFFNSLGLYLQTFCILRQSIAILLIMIGFSYFLNNHENKYTIYIVLNIIAAGFQISSVLMLAFPIVYWIWGKRKRSRWFYFTWGILGASVILASFATVFPILLRYFPGKYRELYNLARMEGRNLLSGCLLIGLYTIIYLAFLHSYTEIDESDLCLFGCLFILGFTVSAFSLINPALGRVNLFVEALLVVFLTKAVRYKYTYKGNLFLIYIYAFAVYFILYIYRDSISVVPYKFLL